MKSHFLEEKEKEEEEEEEGKEEEEEEEEEEERKKKNTKYCIVLYCLKKIQPIRSQESHDVRARELIGTLSNKDGDADDDSKEQ